MKCHLANTSALTMLAAAMIIVSQPAQAQTAIDVWDSSDPGNFVLVATIQTITSAQTGAGHYSFSSASGHPQCVNLGKSLANTWMHESTVTGDLTFGFIFSKDAAGSLFNTAKLNFRIVGSSTNPSVSQSDDSGEAVETPPGSDAFVGTFNYANNTDGIAVSGIGGGAWTVIIDSVSFGSMITSWYAAGGGASTVPPAIPSCTTDLPDISLTLGSEYRLTPAGHPPSGAPVDALEPFADAGADQSVNEGQGVTLDGSGSGPAGSLTYSWAQISGTAVTLSGATTSLATFTAPIVAAGGETLTFELTVTVDGESDTDTVSVTVVNLNHTPVADAGDDQSIAEGAPVTLDGTGSFDIDTDPISYAWVQVSGPTVSLTNSSTAMPTFTAPIVGAGGAPGVVATLVFELVVDDGFPPDAPAAGYTLEDVADQVKVEITNVNNDPTANAGLDQTVDENGAVSLNAGGSSDPDSDALTYAWVQVGGPFVALAGASTATPSLTTPFVSPGGTDLTFEVTVDDGYGGTGADTVVVHVQNANDPPLVSAAQPTIACLWPPNHSLVRVGITGVSDPNNNATITIDGVTQDEPTNGLGDGDTAVDAVINADGTVLLRAERSGNGNGRVYHVHFTASDLEGSASGVVNVCVQHDRKKPAIDGGELFDSTN